MKLDMTTILIIAVLALVSVQTFQLLSLMTTVNSLQLGGAVAQGVSAGMGIGGC